MKSPSLVDKLNNVTTEYPPIDYEEWFSVMDIPIEDIEKRIDLAKEIDSIYYNFFALVSTMIALGEYLDFDYLTEYIEVRLKDITMRYELPYLDEYASISARNTVEVTLDRQGEEYYTSDERASRLAAENSQTICNYSELDEAIKDGYTHKIWRAEIDRKTRDEHREMNGKKIPIDEYFHFSDCDMTMPHDEINGTGRQCSNCRCWLSYSGKEDTNDE